MVRNGWREEWKKNQTVYILENLAMVALLMSLL
jgi:hypothetical protein